MQTAMIDAQLRGLERVVAAGGGEDKDAVLRLAVAQVRAGALVALTRVDARAPLAEDRKGRWPRLYVSAEREGGDLTPRARRATVREALGRLGWAGVKATWSWKAGCACQCSPGFVLRGEGARGRGDVFVDVLVAASERDKDEA